MILMKCDRPSKSSFEEACYCSHKRQLDDQIHQSVLYQELFFFTIIEFTEWQLFINNILIYASICLEYWREHGRDIKWQIFSQAARGNCYWWNMAAIWMQPFFNFVVVKKLIDVRFWNVCLPDKHIQRTDKKWRQLFPALAICAPCVTKFKVMTFYCTDPNSTRRFCWAKNVKEVQSKTGKDHFILNYQYIQDIKYSLSTSAGC